MIVFSNIYFYYIVFIEEIHTCRIFYYNSVILFLTCLTHHNLCSNYMDSVFESSFNLKHFETKWEAL